MKKIRQDNVVAKKNKFSLGKSYIIHEEDEGQ